MTVLDDIEAHISMAACAIDAIDLYDASPTATEVHRALVGAVALAEQLNETLKEILKNEEAKN